MYYIVCVDFSPVHVVVKSTPRFIPPPSGYPSTRKLVFDSVYFFVFEILLMNNFFTCLDPLYRFSMNKHDRTLCRESRMSASRNHLHDSTNTDSSKRLKKYDIFYGAGESRDDVIMLEVENKYVPDSISPSPIPCMSRFLILKVLVHFCYFISYLFYPSFSLV